MKLYNKELKKTEEIDDELVIDYLYTGKYRHNNNKKKISSLDYKIPLYDVYTDTIYPIKKEFVFDRIFNNNYRFHFDKKSNFMKNFDLNILENTYYKIIYDHSFGQNILIYKKKSSNIITKLSTIPYYTKKEINKLSILFKTKKDYNSIKNNEISYDIILKHRNYIIEKKIISLIKYYSLNGSYILNNYLRNGEFENKILNNITNKLIAICKECPEYDEYYYTYRFIKENYLYKYDINDIFIENSFMSTTRNPFYYSKNYSFGDTLLKILIPKNIIGVALSIETFSYFPKEQEIIFPPGSTFKIISKDFDYYDDNLKINNKYELIWIKNDEYIPRKKEKEEIIEINLLKLRDDSSDFSYFNKKIKKIYDNLNNNFQFKLKYNDSINLEDIIFIIEKFNSTNMYKDFYFLKNIQDGILIYCIDKYSFYIEIGIINNMINMHVTNNKIPELEKYLLILSIIGYYFDVEYITINSEIHKYKNYSIDIYNYLKNNYKKYNDIIYITPMFSYILLDNLKKITNISEKYSEIYYIYNTLNIKNCFDFYIYLCENNYYLLDIFIESLGEKYNINNYYYKFDFKNFLKDNNILNSLSIQTYIYTIDIPIYGEMYNG